MENKCCSIEKVKSVLKSLGEEQLSVIIKGDKKAEVVCPHCNKKYIFSEEELIKISFDVKK